MENSRIGREDILRNEKISNSNKYINNDMMSCFFSLPPKQFALLSSVIGVLLIDDLNSNQLNSLGNFIVNIGQTILTAAAQASTLESEEK